MTNIRYTEPMVVKIVTNILKDNLISYKQEVDLGEYGRIDISLGQFLGIECKGSGSKKGKKSERINKQVEKYKNVFDNVWVIVQNKHSDGALIIPQAEKIIPVCEFDHHIPEIFNRMKYY